MIEINQLKKKYGKKEVLGNINLEIKDQEIFGLIGPNGAGKTTLLRCIMGVEQFKGKIKIDSQNIRELSQKEIAQKAALVPQENKINFNFTVKEVVEMGRTAYKSLFDLRRDEKNVKESMEKVGVNDLKDREASSLSGGELQKTILARSIAQETNNLLLDEPTQHLDISNQIEVMNLLEKLCSNKSVLCVFHDLNLASMYCDRLGLIYDGEILSSGNPRDVITPTNIRKAYNQSVRVRQNPIDNSIYVVPEKDKPQINNKQSHIHVVCGGGTGKELLNKLNNQGYSITAGVLNALDSDKKLTDKLEISTIVEAPFSEITKQTHQENIQEIKKANYVVVTDFPVSEGNLKNLLAAKKALDLDKKTIYLKTQHGKQNLLNSTSQELFEEMKKKGLIVVDDVKSILDKLE